MTYDNRYRFIDPVLSAYVAVESEPSAEAETQAESQRDYWVALLVTLTLFIVSSSVFTMAIARFSGALLIDSAPSTESQGALAQWLPD